MLNLKKYHFCLHVLAICFVIQATVSKDLNASTSSFGFDVGFIRNNTSLLSSEVASNVFQLKNNTGKTVRFHLNYSIPAGWTILGQTDKEFQIQSNDSLFVPIRVVPDKFVKGGTSYVITVTIVSDKNVQFAALNWYVSIPAKSNWTVQLPFKHQFFINDNDSSGFQINLRNDGNSDEEIRISLAPDRRLEILRKNDGGASILIFTIPLPAGTDTVLTFPVLRKPNLRANKSIDSDLKSKPSKETYSIQISAKATGSVGSWSGTTQFTKAGNISRYNEFGRSAVPLTLEANVYDVLSNGTTMSLDAYGNTSFSNNRLLNYRFQTVFINNYFNQKSFLGNSHYLGYFDDHASLEIGEVNGWGRSLLTGRGIKGSYHYDKHTLGGMFTRAPGFFKDFRSEGYGVYYNFKIKRFNWSNYYSHNASKTNGLSSELYNSFLSGKINTNHQASIGGGYSIDHVISQNAIGYGYELNYSGSYKKINVSLGNSFGSPTYVLARGINMYTTRTSYAINQRNNYSLTTQNFTQRPSYFINGSLITGNFSRTDRYEFRWGINSPKYSLAIKPAYQWDENRILRVATRVIGIEYNAKNLSNIRYSAMGSMGYAKAVDYALPDFFISRFSSYVRWDKVYLSLRYTYGPMQLAQQARFINDHINPQSLYMVSTYDYWVNNEKVLISTTGNLLYETYFKKITFRLRPEVFYYSKNGIRLSFYASFFSSSQGANPMYDEQSGRNPFEKISDDELNIGFGIRKQFGIPIPGKKFVSLHAVIFKDLNGNHKLDQNEEGVDNMLVNVRALELFNSPDDSSSVKKETGEDFISNKKGEIIYENIPNGIYRIKCSSLIPNGEWFDAGDQDYKVDSKKTLYIPLTRGVRIKGSVLIERDKYSTHEIEVDLSRIRITAIDSSGKSYSVLTGVKGEFVINLPAGQYILSINESALGDNFTFIQNKIELDLSKNVENFSITFNAIERKRKIEIKKFDKKSLEIIK